jgi:hypothetical protein
LQSLNLALRNEIGPRWVTEQNEINLNRVESICGNAGAIRRYRREGDVHLVRVGRGIAQEAMASLLSPAR